MKKASNKPSPNPAPTREQMLANAISLNSKTAIIDLVRPTVVEIEISRKDDNVWINIDGACILRIQEAGTVLINGKPFAEIRQAL